MMAQRRMVIALVVAVIVSATGTWAVMRLLTPDPVPSGTVTVSLEIRHEAEGWSLFYNATTTNNTVLALLLEAADALNITVASRYFGAFGAYFVETINGANGWWRYSVNGEFPGVGADRYVLSDGDEVLWVSTGG